MSKTEFAHIATLNNLRLNTLRVYRYAQQPTVEYTTCISLRSTTYG